MTEDPGAPRCFKDAHVLITGGGSGVGFATAKAFIAAGAAVTIVGRTRSKLESAAQALSSYNRQRDDGPGVSAKAVRYYDGDISQSGFIDDVIAKSEKDGLMLDILINAAGVILRRDAADTEDEAWHSVMRTNIDGVFYASRAAARAMARNRRGGGAIVNIASTCGLVGCAGLAAYNTSKGAVIQLTRSMALELAPRKITVNAVAPGAIETDMLYSEHADREPRAAVEARNLAAIPIGTIATPREVARSILFLAQEKHITGTILSIDGGYTAQ